MPNEMSWTLFVCISQIWCHEIC